MRHFLFLGLFASGNASAFCGTYVGAAGTEIYNNSSEVVAVRQGNRTTLTISNDFETDASNFAMIAFFTIFALGASRRHTITAFPKREKRR